MDGWEFDFLDDIAVPFGAACGNGSVCPNALNSDCNQTGGIYTNQSAQWTAHVQVTMGGPVKR